MTESATAASRYQTDKVRVAIIGVGNCASSFVQGVEYYKDADAERVRPRPHARRPRRLPRPRHRVHAPRSTSTPTRSARTSPRRSGRARTTRSSSPTCRTSDVPVHRGMTHDGLGKYLKEKITKAPGETADIVEILKETKTDVVVSYLPVGSEQATKWYVEQVLEAGCGFVNCIPVFIAREDYWAQALREGRPADRRRRHQVAGRRDDRPPQAGAPVPRARRAR